jgi:hypothetical protein
MFKLQKSKLKNVQNFKNSEKLTCKTKKTKKHKKHKQKPEEKPPAVLMGRADLHHSVRSAS